MAGTNVDNILRLKGFNIELVGIGGDAKSVDGSWRAFSGGNPTVEVIEGTNAQSGLREYSPGLATVSDILLEGFITPTRGYLVTWCNKVFAGAEQRADITKATKKIDGSAGPRDNYFSCLMLRYKFPTCDVRSADPAEEHITALAMRHESA